MDRKSARYIAPRFGSSTSWVYETWQKMGLVMKDNFGDWVLTELGREKGGRMSKSSYLPVPTFEFKEIRKLMMDFLDKTKK